MPLLTNSTFLTVSATFLECRAAVSHRRTWNSRSNPSLYATNGVSVLPFSEKATPHSGS